MNKFVYLTPLALVLSMPVMAEGSDAIDPADVTKVYTQSAIMLNGSSQIQWQGQVAGGLDNVQQFALLGEATFDNKDNDPNKFGLDYQNSRFQYFHVFESGLMSMPKIGASLDYINTRTQHLKNDLLSVGAVAAINPSYTGGLLVFPRAGVVTGSMEAMDQKDDLTGYSLALITAKHVGDSGAYVSVVPEWQDLSGSDSDMRNMSIKTSFNAPLNSSRSWWVNTRFDITKTSIDVNNSSLPSDWQTGAWLGVRYYF